MEGNYGESSDGAATTDLVVELDGVGLARQHSVPLVKIITSTQSHLDDVIKTPVSDVIKPPLEEVIKTPINNIIKTPLTSIIKTSQLTDVMSVGDINNQLSDITIQNKDETPSPCSSTGSTQVATTITSASPINERKSATAFQIEPFWREAAQEPVLTIRCKKTTGQLYKSKFGSGSRGKCIQLGKDWYTPTEFEAHCGRSASKDWKRSLRFQGQSLLTLVDEGILQVHATSCSCGVCLDDDVAAGSVRLHRPYKRKKRDRIILSTDISTKVLKRTVSEESGSSTSTVTLPVSDLGEITVVPGLVIGNGASTPTATITAAPAAPPQAAPGPSSNGSSGSLTGLPLNKAWERMNEVQCNPETCEGYVPRPGASSEVILLGLERSVSSARSLLEELREKTQVETFNLRQKLLNEKEAVTQAKLEAQLSNMAKFQGQSLLTLVDEGILQVHAASCSCGVCLDDDVAAGSVRLHRPYKRKKRDRIILSTDISTKVLKQTVSEESGSSTPTVTLPVSDLEEITMPGLVIENGASAPTATITAAPAAPPPAAPGSSSNGFSGSLTGLPLNKAWERMNEILLGLERSVSSARSLLEELREKTQVETFNLRQKLLNEKEAVTQAKLEAQLSNMAKSSEGFLVQVRDDDGSQSLQPIMLDSLISNVPTLSPAPLSNEVRKKCVNCNRESELECSGCHNKPYCSDFCQRRDWMNHQSECARSSPPPEDPLNNVAQVPSYIFMLSD